MHPAEVSQIAQKIQSSKHHQAALSNQGERCAQSGILICRLKFVHVHEVECPAIHLNINQKNHQPNATWIGVHAQAWVLPSRYEAVKFTD